MTQLDPMETKTFHTKYAPRAFLFFNIKNRYNKISLFGLIFNQLSTSLRLIYFYNKPQGHLRIRPF